MTTTTDTTTTTYAHTLRRISNAIDALKPYWHDKDNVPPALSDELADAVMTAPPEHLSTFDQASPAAEVQELVRWAQNHTERRQHARFFELLKELKGMDPDTPEFTPGTACHKGFASPGLLFEPGFQSFGRRQ